jgi:hypothetical protein
MVLERLVEHCLAVLAMTLLHRHNHIAPPRAVLPTNDPSHHLNCLRVLYLYVTMQTKSCAARPREATWLCVGCLASSLYVKLNRCAKLAVSLAL